MVGERVPRGPAACSLDTSASLLDLAKAPSVARWGTRQDSPSLSKHLAGWPAVRTRQGVELVPKGSPLAEAQPSSVTRLAWRCRQSNLQPRYSRGEVLAPMCDPLWASVICEEPVDYEEYHQPNRRHVRHPLLMIIIARDKTWTSSFLHRLAIYPNRIWYIYASLLSKSVKPYECLVNPCCSLKRAGERSERERPAAQCEDLSSRRSALTVVCIPSHSSSRTLDT